MTPSITAFEWSSVRWALLFAYVARGEGWPAYKRAFDDQFAAFTGKPTTG